jgi:hypothetical protein
MPETAVSNPKRPWRDLYVAALFEADPGKFAERVAEAEKALAVRARELFQAGGHHLEEEHAMDDTMRALKTLRYSRCGPAPQDSAKAKAARVDPLRGRSVAVTSSLPAFGD